MVRYAQSMAGVGAFAVLSPVDERQLVLLWKGDVQDRGEVLHRLGIGKPVDWGCDGVHWVSKKSGNRGLPPARMWLR